MTGNSKSLARAFSWAWRWSLLVTVPIGCLFVLWFTRTTSKYWDLGLQFETLNDAVNLRSIGVLEADGIVRDLELAMLPNAAKREPGLRMLHLYVPDASENALLQELPHSGREYVDASLMYPDGEIRPVSIKFRGDHFWHWAGRKQSLRIKTKKKALWGRMRAINLSVPKMADQVNEHLSYWLASEMGLISPRSEMIELNVNGRHRGVFVLVEQMEEMTLRVNGKMPGDLYSGDMVPRDAYRGLTTKVFESAGLWEKSAVNNHFPEDQRTPLEELVECLDLPSSQERTARLRELVDIESFGAFAAFRTITQTLHYDETHNWKLYYDPWRNHFLPAVWDPVGWHEGWVPRPGREPWLDILTAQIDRALMDDVAFLSARQDAIDSFFDDGLKDRLLEEFDRTVALAAPSIARDPGLVKTVHSLTPEEVERAQAVTRRHIVDIAGTIDGAFRSPARLKYAVAPTEAPSARLEIDGRRGVDGVIIDLDRPPTGPIDVHVSWATPGGFERLDVSGRLVQRGSSMTVEVPFFAQHDVVEDPNAPPLTRFGVEVSAATVDVTLSGPGATGRSIVSVAARSGSQEFVHATRGAAGANHSGSRYGRIGKAGSLLLGDKTIGVFFLVGEFKRIGGPQVGVPLFERPIVENLRDSVRCGDVEVIFTQRANPHAFIGLFGENRLTTTGTSFPEALGNAAFRSLHCCSIFEAVVRQRIRRAKGIGKIGPIVVTPLQKPIVALRALRTRRELCIPGSLYPLRFHFDQLPTAAFTLFLPEVSQLAIGNNAANDARQRFRHNQHDNALAVFLINFRQAGADSIRRRADAFAFRRSKRLGVFLPLAIHLWLVLTNFLHALPVPQAVIEVFQPVECFHFRVSLFRKGGCCLLRALAGRSVDHFDVEIGKVGRRAGDLGDAVLVQWNIQRAFYSSLLVEIGSAWTNEHDL